MIVVRQPRKFQPGAFRHARQQGRAECELCHRYFRVLQSGFSFDRSCSAEINKLEFCLSNFCSAAKLCKSAFEHRNFVVQTQALVNASSEKLSRKTIRDSSNGHRGEREVLTFDADQFKTKTLSISHLKTSRWKSS